MDPVRDSGPRPRPSLIARVRRRLRPPRVLRPTRAGWLFFAITFGVGFAALNTGNNLLYLVLSLLLAFLALSGVLSESALRGIRVRRRLPHEIHARAGNSVLLEISNMQRRVPAFAIVVEDRVMKRSDGRRQTKGRYRRRKSDETDFAGRCFALRVGPGEREARRYRFEPMRRGVVEFAGFRVSTRFPFGLFLKSLDIDAPEDALVYPEITESRVPPVRSLASESGDAKDPVFGQGSAVAGLREFEEGDSMRRVHWRSSLRRGALLVGETEDDRDAEVEVRLRAQPKRDASSGDPERFEERVSRAASEVVRHLQDGLAVALRTDADYIPADSGIRQRARLLAFLALVTPTGHVGGEVAT